MMGGKYRESSSRSCSSSISDRARLALAKAIDETDELARNRWEHRLDPPVHGVRGQDLNPIRTDTGQGAPCQLRTRSCTTYTMPKPTTANAKAPTRNSAKP